MTSQILPAASFGAALVMAAISPVSAQERCKMSWEVPPADTTFVQEHAIDIDDTPNHKVVIYEIHRRFPNDKPNCEGLKRTDEWVRGSGDFTDLNGLDAGYMTIMLENGDKIFSRMSGMNESTINPDGSRKTVVTTVTTYTGGTGKYQRIRGIQRDSVILDPGKHTNQVQAEAEYWFEK